VKNPAGVKEFGFHVRRLRESRDLSQQELADLSDVSKRAIIRIENCQIKPNLDTMISLSKAMNITLKELVDFPLPREKRK
jgi:DNA-binding XRE family transcriptional regulator